MFNKNPIKITQRILKSGYSHLETILLIDDNEATRLDDWVVGYFHCKACDSFEAYSAQLPPIGQNPVVPKMHNQRNAFFRKHHHGDGMIVLALKDMPE